MADQPDDETHQPPVLVYPQAFFAEVRPWRDLLIAPGCLLAERITQTDAYGKNLRCHTEICVQSDVTLCSTIA